MQDKTPIQELIHWLEEWNYNEAAYHARKVFLQKEKEFIDKVYEEASDNFSAQVKPEGDCGFDSVRYMERKQQFLNQLSPK